MIKAIVFDLGGTLIEYAGTYRRWPDLETPGFRAAYEQLSAHDIPLPAYEAFQATGFLHLPDRWQLATAGTQNLRLVDLLADVLVDHGINGVAEEALQTAAEAYQAAIQAQAAPVPGAQETLHQLKETGYKLGLLSNTMFTGLAHQADLTRFGLAQYFDAMLFSADVNKWKPNPEPFLHVLEMLNIRPDAAVYIGDDPAHDVVGGRAAGMRTIHVQSSERFRTPAGVEPDARVDRLPEVVTVLKNWRGN